MTDRDSVLERHMRDLAARSVREWAPVFTNFLERGAAEDFAREAARSAGAQCGFYGGREGAERRMAAFSPDGDVPEESYPIDVLAIRWNAKYGDCGHRSVLGALTGLGIAREMFGDIVFASPDAGDAREGEGLMYVYCAKGVSRHTADQLTSCGRTSVRVSFAKEPVSVREEEGKRIRVTSAGARMDAILSAGYGVSRAQAAQWISRGLVRRNHADEIRPDVRLSPGDVLSVRGKGRLVVEEYLGETKKGRFSYALLRY